MKRAFILPILILFLALLAACSENDNSAEIEEAKSSLMSHFDYGSAAFFPHNYGGYYIDSDRDMLIIQFTDKNHKDFDYLLEAYSCVEFEQVTFGYNDLSTYSASCNMKCMEIMNDYPDCVYCGTGINYKENCVEIYLDSSAQKNYELTSKIMFSIGNDYPFIISDPIGARTL